MTRTARRKLAYLALVLGGSAAVVGLFLASGGRAWVLLVLIVALLVPSRVLAGW